MNTVFKSSFKSSCGAILLATASSFSAFAMMSDNNDDDNNAPPPARKQVGSSSSSTSEAKSSSKASPITSTADTNSSTSSTKPRVTEQQVRDALSFGKFNSYYADPKNEPTTFDIENSGGLLEAHSGRMILPWSNYKGNMNLNEGVYNSYLFAKMYLNHLDADADVVRFLPFHFNFLKELRRCPPLTLFKKLQTLDLSWTGISSLVGLGLIKTEQVNQGWFSHEVKTPILKKLVISNLTQFDGESQNILDELRERGVEIEKKTIEDKDLPPPMEQNPILQGSANTSEPVSNKALYSQLETVSSLGLD